MWSDSGGWRAVGAAALVLALGCGDDDDGATTQGASSGSTAASTTTTTAGSTTTAATGSGATGDGGSSGGETMFEPIACPGVTPDVLTERLCATSDPSRAPDEVFIDCVLETDCFAPPDPAPTDSLVVMAYNLERGIELDQQIPLLRGETDPSVPTPDVLLVSEADRGCARSGERNVVRELAQALSMDYVFGVEFVELPRPGMSITAPCEHGNAILSRYPIGNARLLRHTVNESWLMTDEPRLGGRMAIIADVAVGDLTVQVHSVHFESGVEDGPKRAAQAEELAEIGLAQPNPTIIGGDTNAGLYFLDLQNGGTLDGTTQALLTRGYVDAHIALPPAERETRSPGLVLDLLFLRGLVATDPVICPASLCDGLSDHRAVWATVSVP